MPQPFDYSIGGPSPTEAFMGGVQAMQQQQQIANQRMQAAAQMAAQQQKMQEAQRKVAVFQTLLGPSATAADRDEAMRQLPDEVSNIKTMWEGLDERRRNAYLEAGRSIYNDLMPSADGTVNLDNALKNLNQRADAAKNSGDTTLEKQLRGLADTLKTQQVDPRTLQGLVDLQVRAVDPAAADKMTGVGDASALLRASGIDPYSDKGRELFSNMAFKQGQILITGADTPDGGKYTGTLQDYLARYGSGGNAPTAPTGKGRVYSNVTALPANLQKGDIVNGKAYNGGPVNDPNSWGAPAKGGQTGKASSGDFPR